MDDDEEDIVTAFVNHSMNISGLFDTIPYPLPFWEVGITVATLGSIIVLTVVGNILVIISIFTYTPLRIVQNFFIVSLAIADLTVALLVLPFSVAYIIIGKWMFGIHLCKMWLTCDVLCCTASILNLCAIALDRYWAITDPINYAQKRTVRRVLIMIGFVWIISFIICLPPLLGWNDWPDNFTEDTPCELTQEGGFVAYSSSGSFFVPLMIMTIVYIKIFIATRQRLRARAKASKLNQFNKTKIRHDDDSVISDNDQNGFSEAHLKKLVVKKKKKKKKTVGFSSGNLAPPPVAEESTTDNEPNSSKQSEVTSPRQLKPADVVVKINPGTNSQIHQFIEEKQKISLSKERRAARTLGIIMGVFVVCWLPFFLMYVILPFCESCQQNFSKKVADFITWLGYLNSGLNPLIYTIFNMDFRKAFSKILRCSHL